MIKENVKIKLIKIKRIMIGFIIPGLISLIVSFSVMHYQLKRNQEYWEQQQIMLYNKHILDRKMELFEKFNTTFLKIEGTVSKLKLNILIKEHELKSYVVDTHSEENNLIDEMLSYQSELNEFGSLIQICHIYFQGASFIENTNKLDLLLKKNYRFNNPVLGSDKDCLYDKDIDLILSTLPELDELRLKILKLMLNDINDTKIGIFNIQE